MLEQLSTINKLKAFLGDSAFRQLASILPDRRDIFSYSASHLGITEFELFQAFSDSLMLPLLTEPTVNLRPIIPPGIPYSEYRSQGYVLFRTESNLHGVASIEPAWIPNHFSRFSELPLLLVTWTTLKEWLDSHENRLNKPYDKNVFYTEGVESLTARDLLGTLVRSASNIEANSLYLQFKSGIVHYEVIGSDYVKHQGSIQTPVAIGLECLLHPLPGKQTLTLQIVVNERILTISISMVISESRLQLNWISNQELKTSASYDQFHYSILPKAELSVGD
jgi:hypothetical protein